MTTGTAPARPSGFALRVPDSWFEFDIWRATRTRDLSRMVDARVREVPELAPQRSLLVRLLRSAAEMAERQGALLCATMAEMVDDLDMLAAVAMVFQAAGDPSEPPPTAESIAAQILPFPRSSARQRWRRVDLVDLPAGRAAQVSGIEPIDYGDGRSGDSVMLQTLIPIPGTVDVLNIVLTSPQADLVDPMLDLFTAIAATVSFPGAAASGGDEPTA